MRGVLSGAFDTGKYSDVLYDLHLNSALHQLFPYVCTRALVLYVLLFFLTSHEHIPRVRARMLNESYQICAIMKQS